MDRFVVGRTESDDVSSDVVPALGSEEDVVKMKRSGDPADRAFIPLERKKS